MSKRSETKEIRKKKAVMKQHILRSTIICGAIAVVLIIMVVSFLIGINSDELAIFGVFYGYLASYSVGEINGSMILISAILVAFNFFTIIAVANFREYQREVASWIEVIAVLGITILLSVFFDYQKFIPLILTTIGCILVTVFLYIIQSPADVEY